MSLTGQLQNWIIDEGNWVREMVRVEMRLALMGFDPPVEGFKLP